MLLDVLRYLSWPVVALTSPVWSIDQVGEAVIALVASVWMYATALRIATLTLTRACGCDSPEVFSRWLWITPIPWRWPYRAIVAPLNWYRRQLRLRGRPNARFESLAGMCSRYVFRAGDIPIGVLVWRGKRLWQVVGLSGERGGNFIGAPGSGKSGTCGTILGSLHAGASALFVDAGGDISAALGEHLRATHAFVQIDLGSPNSGQWNLFDEMAAAEQREGILGVVKMLKASAEALVPVTNDFQPVFDLGARDFIASVAGYAYLFAEREKKRLSYVRHLICCGLPHADPAVDPVDNLLFEMEDCHTEDGQYALLTALIARGAATMRSSNSRDGNPFMATARRSTSWIDVDTSTDGSDFLMADLQQGNTVVGIVGSVGGIRGAYQPFVRLMLTMLGHVYTSMPRRKGPPGLVIADEAQNLNQLGIVESGPHMRKYRLRVLSGWQDLPGMAAAYPKTWESILASAEANVFFETADKRTLEWISIALGKTVVRTKVEGTPWLLSPFVRPEQRVRAAYREEIIDLRNPEQVKDALAPGRSRIIGLSANPPWIAASYPYWRALPVGGPTRLRLRAFERHDLVLAKAGAEHRPRPRGRGLPRSRPGLDMKVLKERYRQELRSKLGRPDREDLTLELWVEMIDEIQSSGRE